MIGTLTFIVETDSAGCQAMDSVTVESILCVGSADLEKAEPTVFPNPTTGKLMLDIPFAARVDLLSPDGRCMISTVVDRTAELDLGSISTGVYTLRLIHSSGVFTRKIAVQH